MPRDPYYRKILEGLGGELDPAIFESCAVDLLRAAFPSLVPVHGGSDAGMDGAIAEGEGEAYPLVVTTARDVLRNLTGSLDSYVKHGGKRREVVIATSSELTPRRLRNLRDRAREKGFTLVQVFERRAIADRLYRSSRWARDLLEVTGEPSALSELPFSRRPLRDIDLVGREADLRWLRETAGDLVLIGQPGSGKTYLALQLVRAGEALFLASDDEARVADACRELEPPAIVVDDAHTEPEKLDRLRHLREEIGAGFRILATAWPGAEDGVAAALGESSQVRHLELLTRKEILQVLRAIGIDWADDDPYLRELVNQSANKPGLAVTLGSLGLRGEWRDLLTGRAIRRSLIPALTQVLGQDPTRLLACFALGGDGGMGLETVGSFLGMSRHEVHRWATEAAHGGVLDVLSDDRLRVQPEVLRFAVLREAFFTPPSLGNFRQLLKQAASRSDGVETLVKAALLRVEVPREQLRELVQTEGSVGAWRGFSVLGSDEAEWVLEHFDREIGAIADSLLVKAPRSTIRRLLSQAEKTAKEKTNDREEIALPLVSPPLQAIQDWLREIPDERQFGNPIEESLRRRRLVIEESQRGVESGLDASIAVHAICLALSPRLESTRGGVDGQTFTTRWGALPADAVPGLLEMWASVRVAVLANATRSWSRVRELVDSWVGARSAAGWAPAREEREKEALRGFTEVVLRDLAAADLRPLYLRRTLKEWAKKLELQVLIDLPGDFETLFPVSQSGSPHEKQEQAIAARRMAEQWALKPPREAARALSELEGEAEPTALWGTGMPVIFAQRLAESVESPALWLTAFLDRELHGSWVHPLLDRVVRERVAGWELVLQRCLEHEAYLWVAEAVALRHEDLPPELLELALERAPAHLVNTLCLRNEVPSTVLRRLLRHSNEEIAIAAAVGECCAGDPGSVRQEIREEWRSCILRCPCEAELDRWQVGSLEFWLRRIFESDIDLGFSWLESKLPDLPARTQVSSDGLYAAAIQGLTTEQRVSLIGRLHAGYTADRLIRLLVGDSPAVYRHLLEHKDLVEHFLAPLKGQAPNASWAEMAQLALGRGIPPRTIAGASFQYEGVRSGFDQKLWERWKKGFEALLTTARGQLREVAELGFASAEKRIARVEERQREFELTGLFPRHDLALDSDL